MSMMKDAVIDYVQRAAAVTNVPFDLAYECYEAIMMDHGELLFLCKVIRAMQEHGWTNPHYAVRAAALPHFDEIFCFEKMENEWIEELSMVSGYEESELHRIYGEVMADDDEERSFKDRLENFVIITLERDW